MDTFTGSSVKALEMVQLSHIDLNFRLFAQFGFTRLYTGCPVNQYVLNFMYQGTRDEFELEFSGSS